MLSQLNTLNFESQMTIAVHCYALHYEMVYWRWLELQWHPASRGDRTRSCVLFIGWGFPYISICASRKLNVV